MAFVTERASAAAAGMKGVRRVPDPYQLTLAGLLAALGATATSGATLERAC